MMNVVIVGIYGKDTFLWLFIRNCIPKFGNFIMKTWAYHCVNGIIDAIRNVSCSSFTDMYKSGMKGNNH